MSRVTLYGMTVDLAITPGGRIGNPGPVGTPGNRKNWVDDAGGLPRYIRMVAHALIRQGHTPSSAIAIAVATMKKWAAGGGDVTPKVRAAAAAAVAQWEAKKAGAHADLATDDAPTDGTESVVDLAPGNYRPPYDWKHGYIPLTHAAALSKAKGSRKSASKIAARYGVGAGKPVGKLSPAARKVVKSDRARKARAAAAAERLAAAQDAESRGRGTPGEVKAAKQAVKRAEGSHEAAKERLRQARADKTAKGIHGTTQEEHDATLEVARTKPATTGRGDKMNTTAGPSNAEKIANAEKMYGTGSVEHKRAQRRFGGGQAAKKAASKPADPPLSDAEKRDMASRRTEDLRWYAQNRPDENTGKYAKELLEARGNKPDGATSQPRRLYDTKGRPANRAAANLDALNRAGAGGAGDDGNRAYERRFAEATMSDTERNWDKLTDRQKRHIEIADATRDDDELLNYLKRAEANGGALKGGTPADAEILRAELAKRGVKIPNAGGQASTDAAKMPTEDLRRRLTHTKLTPDQEAAFMAELKKREPDAKYVAVPTATLREKVDYMKGRRLSPQAKATYEAYKAELARRGGPGKAGAADAAPTSKPRGFSAGGGTPAPLTEQEIEERNARIAKAKGGFAFDPPAGMTVADRRGGGKVLKDADGREIGTLTRADSGPHMAQWEARMAGSRRVHRGETPNEAMAAAAVARPAAGDATGEWDPKTKSTDTLRGVAEYAFTDKRKAEARAELERRETAGPGAGVRVEHTAEGTLVHGTTRGDRAQIDALKAQGFKWSRNLGAWYLPRNLRHETRDRKVAALRKALPGAEIESDGRRQTAAERHAATLERASERAERKSNQADRLQARADDQQKRSDDYLSAIPLGQPNITDTSAGRAFAKKRAKMQELGVRGWETQKEANTAREAAERAERAARGTESPVTTRNRIKKNEARIRKLKRELEGTDLKWGVDADGNDKLGHYPAKGERASRLRGWIAEAEDQIAFDKSRLEASGVKTYGKDTVAVGDMIKYGGDWYPVVKSNAKSASIPWFTGNTWTADWGKVTDHKSADEFSEDQLQRLIDDAKSKVDRPYGDGAEAKLKLKAYETALKRKRAGGSGKG